MSEWRYEEIPFEKLTVDPEMQVRADKELDPENIERCKDGAAHLPPAPVFDDGAKLWLAGGFHRYQGRLQAGYDTLSCQVKKGARLDAFKHSRGENRDNGLARSNEDKRNAVLSAVAKNEKESLGWSNREICEMCGVNPGYLTDLRRQMEKLSESDSKDKEGSNSDGGDSAEPTPAADDAPAVNPVVGAMIHSGELAEPEKSGVLGLPIKAQGDFVRAFKESHDAAGALKAAAGKGKKGKAAAREAVKDKTGAVVPDQCRDAFADPSLPSLIEELQQVESMFRVESWLSRAGKLTDHYGFILIAKLKEHAYESLHRLQVAVEALSAGLPYAVCPECRAVDSKKDGKCCKACRGYGCVPEWRFKELKEGAA